MYPYYLLWAVLFLCSFCEVFRCPNLTETKSMKEFIYFVAFSSFVIITCFKGNVGTDYNGYRNLYEIWGAKKYTDPFVSIQIEPLFWAVSHIFNFFRLPFEAFWFFIAFISFGLKFYFFKKYSPSVVVALLIYLSGLFIERDFDGIRQGLSIGIAYIAIDKLLSSKLKQFFIFVFLAIGIHVTSIIFLISPILFKIKLSKKWYLFFLVIGLCCTLFHFDFLSIVLKFLPNGYIKSRTNTYLSNSIYSGETGIKLGLIIRLFIFVVYLMLGNKKCNQSLNEYNFFLNGFFFAILCSLFFNNMDIISHRLAYGFREFQIIIIPLIFYSWKKQKDRLTLMPIIGAYSFLLFFRMINAPNLKEYYIYDSLLFHF